MIKGMKTVSLLLVLFMSVTVALQGNSHALNLSERSIALQNTEVSTSNQHTFKFNIASTDPLGSIVFEYCESPLPTVACVAPTGLDVSSVTLSSESGETGFSIYSATGNQIILSRASVPANLVTATYVFNNATNPSVIDSFSVRISTHSSIDGTGAHIDRGSVVSSTTQGIGITTEVPPILVFCVGTTIPTDCSSASGYGINLGELRSNQTRFATSQMMGGTNADFGYVISANGTTMASGTNAIDQMSVRGGSVVGASQFGLNLRANSSPALGAEPSGPGTASPTGDYNVPNQFKFVPGEVVASSADETNTVKFTVSYIVNVPNGQAPGVYTSTITYICVATF